MTVPDKSTSASDKKVRRLTITRQNEHDWKPFIDSHERLNDPFSPEVGAEIKDPLSTRTPLNKALLEQAKLYRKQLPSLMEKHVDEVKQFFLNEIAPLLLSTSNGLQDAREILASALEEEPAVSTYFSRIEKAVDTAVEIRILNFVSKLSGLDPTMRSQFLMLTLTKDASSSDPNKTILSALQHIEKLVKQTEVSNRSSGRRVERPADSKTQDNGAVDRSRAGYRTGRPPR